MRKTDKLRVSSLDDQAGIKALLEACYAPLMARDYDPQTLAVALPLITDANPALLSCGTFYVIEDPTDGIVGCGGWTPEDPATLQVTDGGAHIRHFATHPDHTRRGLATTIFLHCQAEAVKAGATKLGVYSSRNAVPFYRAMGFTPVQDIGIVLAPEIVFPAVWMTKNL